MDHHTYNKLMSGQYTVGLNRQPLPTSEQLATPGIEQLAESINLNASENAGYIQEYREARQKGMLRSVHVLSYVRTRRIDDGIETL